MRRPRDGSAFVLAWDQKEPRKRGPKKAGWPIELVYYAKIDAEGNVSTPTLLAGSLAAPAIRPTVASNGAGAVLIAYEQHPAKGDLPITISFQILKGL